MSLAVRLRLRDMPLERDEGEFAYIGQLMLQGVPPYQTAYTLKLPGTHLMYALSMAAFGQTAAGIRVGLALINGATVLLVFFLAREVLDVTAGLVAAAAFAVLSLSPTMMGLSAHATHFVIFFATAGMLVLLRARKSQRPRDAGLSGALFGLAMLMKQPGALFGLFGLVWLLWGGAGGRGETLRSRMRLAAAFCAGGLTPLLLTVVVLAALGVLPQFFFWTVTYARAYGSIVRWAEVRQLLFSQLSQVALGNLLLWLLAGVGLLLAWRDERLAGKRWWFTGFALASVLATSAGLYFRHHYFLLLLPAATLLMGLAVSKAAHWIRTDTSIELLLTLPIFGLLAVGFLWALVMYGEVWFAQSPADACYAMSGTRLFTASREVASYLRTQSAPQSRVAVLGSEPELFFEARRRSATGFIYAYPLMEPHRYAAEMHQRMIEELQAARPEYVVHILHNQSWLRRPDSKSDIFNWWTSTGQSQYELDRIVQLGKDPPSGPRAPGEPGSASDSGNCLMIWKRKPGGR